MRIRSLKQRMALVSSVVLLLAFSAIYLSIKTAYTNASLSYIQDSLTAQTYALMAEAEDHQGQLLLPEVLRNDRLNHLNSGLVAFVLDIDGGLIWRSRSSEGYASLPEITLDYSLEDMLESELDSRMMFWIGDRIIWEHDNAKEGEYLFIVGETQSVLRGSVRQFKREIALWLSLTALILILVLLFALNISLNPLKKAQQEIELVSRGDAERLVGEFPKELEPLTSSINHLLESERLQKSRYRDTLGNLAHSLKTPLAVIKSDLDSLKQNSPGAKSQLIRQVERIDDIVRYQLNRALATSGQALKRKTLIAPEVDKIVSALHKVHADKSLAITAEIPDDSYFPGEPGDLMELVGNIADNACKWAATEVMIRVSADDSFVVIQVSDDGPGIPEKKRQLILNRGKRLDQQAEGQGLGLSIVMDIIKNYRGELGIENSIQGGSSFSVKLPLG